MRKLIRYVLLLTLVVSLIGCSSQKVKNKDDKTYDVVVVGSGGAGLVAAIEAFDAGQSVVILEKMPIAGGNTNRASGGMNASETSVEAEGGVTDSNDLFFEDTMKGGYQKNNPELVRYMVDHSADAIAWLSTMGVKLTGLSTSGGQSAKRTHTPQGGSAVGSYLVENLMKQIKSRGIEIAFYTRATDLMMKNGVVDGVKAINLANDEVVTYHAKAVVIATGGFGGSEELWTKYNPALAGYVTTNHAGATGDGIVMIEAIGGALVDIEQIQIHPTVEQKTSELISESVRGSGAILIDQQGKRFVNDLETRDVVSAAIIALPEQYAYVFFDETLRLAKKEIDKYINKGFVIQADTLEELAKKLNMDEATLVSTVDTWNTSVSAGVDQEFGRKTGMEISLNQAPYYAIQIAPGVHHTMGGVKINTETQVLDTKGVAIAGLYAAGEVTGGVHGGNRLGGNAVTDIIVFGRQAGKNAATYAKAHGGVGHIATTTVVTEKKDVIKSGITAQFKDGTYSATAKGNNGDVVVSVIVDKGYITSIVTKHEETGSIYSAVEETLIPLIIYEQSADVDAITGATLSSNAVKEAMKSIMEQAKK